MKEKFTHNATVVKHIFSGDIAITGGAFYNIILAT